MLGGVLLAGAYALAFTGAGSFSTGGWFTGVALLAFAAWAALAARSAKVEPAPVVSAAP